jgi:hypothetical protein
MPAPIWMTGAARRRERRVRRQRARKGTRTCAAGFAQFEQQAPAEEPVKPPPSKEHVNPTLGAPSTSGAAAVVESTAQVLADHGLVRGIMGPNVDPEKVIESCRAGAAHWAAALNARNAPN